MSVRILLSHVQIRGICISMTKLNPNVSTENKLHLIGAPGFKALNTQMPLLKPSVIRGLKLPHLIENPSTVSYMC